MPKDRSVQHHYISKFLIHNFCDDNGQVWVGDKIEENIFKRAPNKVFKVGDLNTDHDLDNIDIKHDTNEQLLQRVESDAAPAIQRIISHARNNEPPDLSPNERDSWKRFYHASCRRTPEFSDEMLNLNERFDDVWSFAVDRLFCEAGMVAPDSVLVGQYPELRKIKAAAKQNTKARFHSGDHPLLQADVEQFCRNTGLLIAVIRCRKRSFVIGSHGVAIVRRGAALGSWLPIAHDVAVAPTSRPDSDWLLPLDHSAEHIIKKINTAAIQQSRFFAGRSEPLIRSLVARELKRQSFK